MFYLFDSGFGASVVVNDITLSQSQKDSAVIVDVLPIPNVTNGKTPILRANHVTNTAYYEYVDKPADNELDLLKAQMQANSELTDFHEELIVEMAMVLYK
jgi:hypothetical protein